MDSEFQQLSQKITQLAELTHSLRQENAECRAQIKSLTEEKALLAAQLTEETSALKHQLYTETAALKDKLTEETASLTARFSEEKAALTAKMDTASARIHHIIDQLPVPVAEEEETA